MSIRRRQVGAILATAVAVWLALQALGAWRDAGRAARIAQFGEPLSLETLQRRNPLYDKGRALTGEPEPTRAEHACISVVLLVGHRNTSEDDMDRTLGALADSSARLIQVLVPMSAGTAPTPLRLDAARSATQLSAVRAAMQSAVARPLDAFEAAVLGARHAACFLMSFPAIGDAWVPTLHEQAAWALRVRSRVGVVSSFYFPSGARGGLRDAVMWNPYAEAPVGSASPLIDRLVARTRVSPGAVYRSAAVHSALLVLPEQAGACDLGADPAAVIAVWLHCALFRLSYATWTITEVLYARGPFGFGEVARQPAVQCFATALQADERTRLLWLPPLEAPLSDPFFWKMKRPPLPHRIDFEAAFGGDAALLFLTAYGGADEAAARTALPPALAVAWHDAPGPADLHGRPDERAAARFARPTLQPMDSAAFPAGSLVPAVLLGELLCYLLRTRNARAVVLRGAVPAAYAALPSLHMRGCAARPPAVVEWVDECGDGACDGEAAASLGMAPYVDRHLFFSPSALLRRAAAGEALDAARVRLAWLPVELPPPPSLAPPAPRKGPAYDIIVVMPRSSAWEAADAADATAQVLAHTGDLLLGDWSAEVYAADRSFAAALEEAVLARLEAQAIARTTRICGFPSSERLARATAAVILLDATLDDDTSAVRAALAAGAVVVTVQSPSTQHYICPACGMLVTADDRLTSRAELHRVVAQRIAGSLVRLISQARLASTIRSAAADHIQRHLSPAVLAAKFDSVLAGAHANAANASSPRIHAQLMPAMREIQRMVSTFAWV